MTSKDPFCSYIHYLADHNRRTIVEWALNEPDPVRQCVGLIGGALLAGAFKNIAMQQFGCACTTPSLAPGSPVSALPVATVVTGVALQLPRWTPPQRRY